MTSASGPTSDAISEYIRSVIDPDRAGPRATRLLRVFLEERPEHVGTHEIDLACAISSAVAELTRGNAANPDGPFADHCLRHSSWFNVYWSLGRLLEFMFPDFGDVMWLVDGEISINPVAPTFRASAE